MRLGVSGKFGQAVGDEQCSRDIANGARRACGAYGAYRPLAGLGRNLKAPLNLSDYLQTARQLGDYLKASLNLSDYPRTARYLNNNP